jgi:hypothetical protein
MRKQLAEAKPAQERAKNPEAFSKFAEAVRKSQPFLRKASDMELEGIFSRLTPAERKQYSEVKTDDEPKRKRSLESKKEAKPSKKKSVAKEAVKEDFINDESEESDYASGSDISLVSESELEEEEESKVKKVSEKKEQSPRMPEAKGPVKRFTWT